MVYFYSKPNNPLKFLKMLKNNKIIMGFCVLKLFLYEKKTKDIKFCNKVILK